MDGCLFAAAEKLPSLEELYICKFAIVLFNQSLVSPLKLQDVREPNLASKWMKKK